MSQLTVKKVEALIRAGGDKTKRYGDGGGLYLVVPHSGYPSWMLRFTSNKKRREMTLGKVSDISLRDARLLAAEKMKQVREGFDPLIQRKRAEQEKIKTVNDLFSDWYPSLEKRLKHPNIPKRVFLKDIAPHIGDIPLEQVNARDIRTTINAITAAGKPAIANDALNYCKQLFNHGMKLDLMQGNPASAFTVRDAGGVEKSRDRALTTEELKQFFNTAKQNPMSFTRDNYLACALLVCLGVRKSELCEAKWEEFDLEKAVWELPKERSKTNVALTIPLAKPVLEWFEELKVRSLGSEYVFPSRRSSKNPHMGPDTLNRAITKLFGHEPGKKKQPPNLMGDMPHFTVHDLRRTCRTLLAQQGTPGHVAERCLNHKLKGVEGIYDRHDYFEERREALTTLAAKVHRFI
ncbi:tyrosine-type recombinase/integrase [Vibrio zhugei]|uniref:Tyrosine-type recombinase/integrase n=1 Tax=Vibrio zhugei TaxID=2479546 RepID=A0ABV7C9F8_9VIBR|nr:MULTISPECIES: site-specific integrase [Vibrio]MDW1807650.1 tyrosine-type recombinase/integrase [Vibrio sp. Vb2362]EJU9538022.1 tyrosine-type recombinase/integrase [Vibrio alginolyticus]MCE9842959.1 tyrosine-type recombinase/integrase [Vibrio antiquarius]MCR9533343.1 tyrosine-type recombinase/integrase [Vibrio alginolyticus]MCZ6373563.1 tyrosine-type recombinase/integrase [Vibrio parahaemolyticus]